MKALPIGTVVAMKKPEQAKRMIIGYYPTKDGRLYDYLAVMFPIGLTLEAQALGIRDEDIDHVIQIGYENDLFARMQKNMDRLDSQIRKSFEEAKG